MNILSRLSAIIAAVLLVACSSSHRTDYHVTIPVAPELDGLTAYLVDYDTGDRIDSLVIASPEAVFSGNIDEPRMVYLVIDGSRHGAFILEGGDISFDLSSRLATGSPLNEELNRYGALADSIAELYDKLPTDSAGLIARAAVVASLDSLNRAVYLTNPTNPVGYYAFLQTAYELPLDSLEAEIARHPELTRYSRVNRLVDAGRLAAQTAPGAMYKDFAVTYADSTYRLSDYVGRDGRFTLVDFWASWCGPCIKETATIKQILARHSDRLNVLGVAVWDEPENTLHAISQHSLPWPQILNAQKIPTDLYGISGIPCIILIAPDGRIVSRGKQGPELIADVEAALAAATPAAAE